MKNPEWCFDNCERRNIWISRSYSMHWHWQRHDNCGKHRRMWGV